MRLRDNWNKEDMRTAVNTWYSAGGDKTDTLIYPGGVSGFAYYIRRQKDYSPDWEKNVKYMSGAASNLTEEEYTEYLNGIYENEWPKELFLIGTHTFDDINALIEAFVDKGYVREDLCNRYCYCMRLSCP